MASRFLDDRNASYGGLRQNLFDSSIYHKLKGKGNACFFFLIVYLCRRFLRLLFIVVLFYPYDIQMFCCETLPANLTIDPAEILCLLYQRLASPWLTCGFTSYCWVTDTRSTQSYFAWSRSVPCCCDPLEGKLQRGRCSYMWYTFDLWWISSRCTQNKYCQLNDVKLGQCLE